MFLSNLSVLGRKVFWLILTIMLSIAAISIHAIIRIKASTAGTNTACSKVTTSTGNEFSSYLSIEAAQMRSESSATTTGEVVVYTSNVLLYPSHYICAEGHAVKITGETTAKAGSEAQTTVWVDENDNGVVDFGETLTESSALMSLVYIFGGSDNQAITCDNISITMEGGEIGAIFAGGFQTDVVTNTVDVQITGGSVHYVDCGSHKGPDYRILSYDSEDRNSNYQYLKATTSINVMLRNCIYRSNVPVNGINIDSYSCPNVTVYDYSEHRDVESFTRFTPTFNNYVLKLEQNSYLMGGNVTIPANMDVEARVLVAKENAKVNNLGKFAVPRCENIHMLDGATWSGNAVKTAHQNMSLGSYTYSEHKLTCATCGTTVCRAHVWSYSDNGDGTHTKRCGVCGYSYSEDHDQVQEYDNASSLKCKYCENVQTVSNAASARTAGSAATCSHDSHYYKYITSCHHVNHRAEGVVEYDINHGRVACCSGCDIILPFVSGSRLFASLTDVCNLMKTAGTTSATVTMNCDAAPGETEVIDISGKTIYLEMNGCDINRDVQVTAGTLKISNSKFGTYHYSHFSKNFTASSSATIEADGCYFNSLSAGASTDATIKLGNVRCGNLNLNGKNKLTLTDKVVVEKRLFKDWPSGTYLPSGYVIGEMLADGTWLSLYDHTATNIPYYLGPLEKTGNATTSPVAIMPCEDHKLTSATSKGTSGHQGTCTLCGLTVIEDHDMTTAVSQASVTGTNHTDCHSLKCSLCSYTNGTGYHDYDLDGNCLACGEKAASSIRGTFSAKKIFFKSFDDAFALVNNTKYLVKDESATSRGNMVLYNCDTIALYEDQTFTYKPAFNMGVPYDNFTITGKGKVTYGVRLYVEGNNHTLDFDGTLIFKEGMRNDPLFNQGFEMSHDTKYASTLYKHSTGNYTLFYPERGYKAVVSNGYVTPTSCSHYTYANRTYTYYYKYSQVSEDGIVKDYHNAECSQCRKIIRQSHDFSLLDANGNYCSKCSVLQSNVSNYVARVYTEGSTTPQYYTSLSAAWFDAISSQSDGKLYTIQLLKDATIPASTQLPIPYNDCNFVFDGTDDDGVEHTISSTGSRTTEMIYAEYGHLTIKSGIFQSYRSAIKTQGNGHLTIEGGTFNPGLDTSGSYAGVTNANGVQQNVKAGSIIMKDGSRVKLSSASTSFSGTVQSYSCNHSNIVRFDERPRSCTYTGNEACFYCQDCRVYVNLESGEMTYSMPAIASSALGHNYVNHVCSRCGVYDYGLRATKYAADGSLIQASLWHDFSSAWAVIKQWDSSASEGQKYVIKLEADVTLSADEDASTLVEGGGTCDITIDLNGHNLNLDALYQVNTYLLNCTYRNLTVTNSSYNKSVLSGPIIQNSEGNAFTLNNVEYRTMKLKCANLVLTNNAGFVLLGRDDNTSNVLLKNLSVENGCYLDGEACYLFKLYGTEDNGTYEMDLDESLVDLAHHLTVEQQDCNGDWFTVPGTSKFVLTSGTVGQLNPISVNTSKGTPTKSCYRWHAVKQDVEHTLNGRRCSVCGLNTHHYLLHDKTAYTDSYHQYIGAVYERPIAGSDVWESLYAPMSFNTEDYAGIVEFGDIYSFGRMFDTNGNGRIDSGDETWLIVDLMTSGKTEANYPYLIRGKSAMNVELSADQGVLYSSSNSVNSCSTAQATYTFCGTNLGAALDSPAGILMLNSKGELSSISNNTVAPQRWYVQTTGNSNSAELRQAYSNGIRVMVIGEDISQETAIKLLKGETVEVDLDGQHYTLDGRKATKTQSGLRIVNGKKIITK